ncbi:OLC1v1000279C1 [Oldenlandia corymbosa var. corymbosa]|uniref:OLC1v1000279C1 n=1 Tax=Oldenlandia corymbosa var. corymbosa TaxID=529605 RepID=A0AAV1D2X8_OLDCO|nr:OLC1v1000279C1 [Oldenlandia corymbosa var. corymbosa]
MNSPPLTIAQRVKGRKLFQEKLQEKLSAGRKQKAKYVESDKESEEDVRSVGLKRRMRPQGPNPGRKRRRSNNTNVHIESLEESDEVIAEHGNNGIHDVRDDSSSESSSSDGIELLSQTPAGASSMNFKPKPIEERKVVTLSEESEESDGQHFGHSDSEPEVQLIDKAMSSKSMLRKGNGKGSSHSSQQGLGTKKLEEKQAFEEIKAFLDKRPASAQSSRNLVERVRNYHAGAEVNYHSSFQKNSNYGRKPNGATGLSKNNIATNREEETKYFNKSNREEEPKYINKSNREEEPKYFNRIKKGSKSKKEEILSYPSSDSSSSTDTDDDDSDDEEYQAGETYSSASEELLSSSTNEEDEKGEDEEEDEEYSTTREEESEGERTKEEVTEKSRTKKSKPPQSEDEESYKIKPHGKIRESKCRRGGDQACFEKADNESIKGTENLDGEKTNQLHKKVRFSEQKKKVKKVEAKPNNLVDALFKSIVGNDDVVAEVKIHELEVEPSTSNRCILPKKFSFEDEEPKPVEKSEDEKMVEGLFDELEYAFMSETNSLEEDSVVENGSNADDDDPCSRGSHDLRLDEELGLVCCICNHIELERKYVDPKFAPNIRKDTRRGGDYERQSFFNDLDFTPEGSDFGDPLSACKGSVWDTIPGVQTKLYEHQREGFEFLWKNLEGTIDLAEIRNFDKSQTGGCIISHAPGTGKTLLTIVFIHTYLKLFPSSRPVIIAPASMLLTWEEEFKKWNPDLPFHNINNGELSGKENKKALEIVPKGKTPTEDLLRLVKIYSWTKEKSILGISYSLFEMLVGGRTEKKDFRKILVEMPGLVVMDEGHTPRSSKSLLWMALLKLQTNKRIILTGTPFQNNFGELFNTLRLVRPSTAELLSKDKTFSEMITARGRYSRQKNKHLETCYSISKNQAVDNEGIEKLKAAIAPFVHVHKGTILQRSLPGLKDSVILLNPQPIQKRFIGAIDASRGTASFEYDHKVALISTHPSLFRKCNPNAKEKAGIDMEALEKLRMDPSQGVKTKFVMEMVRLSCKVHEKVLVFTQYKDILHLMAQQLETRFKWEEGRHVIKMYGDVDQKTRQNIITSFNDPYSDAFVLLASTKCCSEGINLVGASRVVLIDVVWNPSVERQAICRAYRLGQKKVVHTYHLMAAGTTEESKYCRQIEKDRLSELVFTSTTKENIKVKNPAAAVDDAILQQMLADYNFKDMFEKIIYQPKEANLIESFGLEALM